MENPIQIDDLRVPLFLETPMCHGISRVFFQFKTLFWKLVETLSRNLAKKITGEFSLRVFRSESLGVKQKNAT